MTIFLCILALLAVCSESRVKTDSAWALVAWAVCHVLLVLGLATLALVAHLW